MITQKYYLNDNDIVIPRVQTTTVSGKVVLYGSPYLILYKVR